MKGNWMENWAEKKTDLRAMRWLAWALALCVSLLSLSQGLAAPLSAGDIWRGPQGEHAVAPWPFDPRPDSALVSNPNPGDRLHLRAQPGKEALSLGRYYNGVQVQLLGPEQEGWVPVRVGTLTGFMMARFLKMPGQGLAPLSAMPVMQVNIPAGMDGLPLMAAQSTDCPPLGQYGSGTPVIVMGFDSMWAHVIVEGQTGFMLGRYLK